MLHGTIRDALTTDRQAWVALRAARSVAEDDGRAFRSADDDAARWGRVCARLTWIRQRSSCRHERRGLAGAWADAARVAMLGAVLVLGGCEGARAKPAFATACGVARAACAVVEGACGSAGAEVAELEAEP